MGLNPDRVYCIHHKSKYWLLIYLKSFIGAFIDLFTVPTTVSWCCLGWNEKKVAFESRTLAKKGSSLIKSDIFKTVVAAKFILVSKYAKNSLLYDY